MDAHRSALAVTSFSSRLMATQAQGPWSQQYTGSQAWDPATEGRRPLRSLAAGNASVTQMCPWDACEGAACRGYAAMGVPGMS
jgi:hypothetical protein